MLVLDTTKTKKFVKTLSVLGPTHSGNILEFVSELLETVETCEIALKHKNKRINELEEDMKLKEAFEEQIEKQDEKILAMQPDTPSEEKEESAYAFAGDDEPAF